MVAMYVDPDHWRQGGRKWVDCRRLWSVWPGFPTRKRFSGRSRRTTARSPATSDPGWRPDGAERSTRGRVNPPSGSASRNNVNPMTVTFAEKLSRIPHYEPGNLARRRQGPGGDRRRGQARLERVPFPASPRGGGGGRSSGRRSQSLPGSGGEGPARAIANHHETDPARIAVSNGSCEIPARPRRWRSASPATRSSTPGRRSRCTRTCPPSREPGRSGSRWRRDTSTTSMRCSRRSRPPRSF